MGFKKKKKYSVLSIILTLALICSSLGYVWAQADEAAPYEIVENSMDGGSEKVEDEPENIDGLSAEELGLPSGDISDEMIRESGADVADKSTLVMIKSTTISQDGSVLNQNSQIDLSKDFTIKMVLSLPFDAEGGEGKFGLGDSGKFLVGKGIKLSDKLPEDAKRIPLQLAGINTQVGEIVFKNDADGVVAEITFKGDKDEFKGKTLGDVTLNMDFSVNPDVNEITLFNNEKWQTKDTSSGARLTKKGEVDYQQQRINWTINVSHKTSLANFKINDDLSKVGKLVSGTFSVTTKNGNPISGVNSNADKEINYTFPNEVLKEATVTFSTELDWADFDNKNEKGVTKTNRAVLLDNNSKYATEDSAEVTVFGNWGNKTGEILNDLPEQDKAKYHDYNFEDYYYIKWEIIFNGTYDKNGGRVSKGIQDVIIEDTLPKNVFNKNQLEWVSAEFSEKNGNGWTTTKKVDTQPIDGQYKLKDLGINGKLDKDVRLTIFSRVEKSKILTKTKYTNIAYGVWNGKRNTSFNKDLELNEGNEALHKNATSTFKMKGKDIKRDYVENEVDWEITVADDIIKDDAETYFYDVFLTHPKIDYNTLKNKYDADNKFKIKTENSDTDVDLESGIDIRDVLPTSDKKSAYLNNFTTKDSLQTKIYDLYYQNGSNFEKAGKVLEVKGFNKNPSSIDEKGKKVYKFNFKSKIIDIGLLSRADGDGQTVNMGYLVNKPRNSSEQAYGVAMVDKWPYYMNKMLHKTAIPKENSERILDDRYSLNDINQNPELEKYDNNHDKVLMNVFSDKSRSILYRLSVNASGIDNSDGSLEMNLIDNLPEGWEVDKVNDAHKYLVYKGKKVAKDIQTEYVEAVGNPLTETELQELMGNTDDATVLQEKIGDRPRRLFFKLNKIKDPYVVLLRLKKKYVQDKPEDMEGLVSNTARVSMNLPRGYANSVDKTVLAAYDSRFVGKNRLSKELNRSSQFVNWSIEYRPERMPEEITEQLKNANYIKLVDTLGEGLSFILDDENKLFFGGKYYVLTETDGAKVTTYTKADDLEKWISYDHSNKTLSLIIPKKDWNKAYKLEYVTSISNAATANNTLKFNVQEEQKIQFKPMKLDISAWASVDWSSVQNIKFRVFKTDEANNPLEGAEFVIKGGNTNKEVISGTNGYCEVELPVGKYTIEEKAALKIGEKSYLLPQNNRFNFEIKRLNPVFTIVSNDSNPDMKLEADSDSHTGLKIHVINRTKPSTPPTTPGQPPSTPGTSNPPSTTPSTPGPSVPPSTTPPTPDPSVPPSTTPPTPGPSNPPSTTPPTPGTSVPPSITPPSTPIVPSTPPSPEVPSKPSSPVEPSTPPSPEVPSTPSKPNVPSTPSKPGTPVTPSNTPEEPETPIEENETPETPVDPPSTTPEREIPTYTVDSFPDPNAPDSPDEFMAVDENGTPLGRYVKKTKPDGTSEYVLVDDDGTPQGVMRKKPGLPKTGGSSNVFYYLFGGLSLIAAVVLLFRRKRW